MSGSMKVNWLHGQYNEAARSGPVSAAETPKGKHKRKRKPPVSIRFSDEERAMLEQYAEGKPLGPYIKACVLKTHRIKRKPRNKTPSLREEALARALRRLGHAGIFGLLNDVLEGGENGRLALTGDEDRALRHAAFELIALRGDLMAALGMRSEGLKHTGAAQPAFAKASADKVGGLT